MTSDLSADGAGGFGLSNLRFEVRIYTGTPASPCVLLTAQWEVREFFHEYYSTVVLLMLSADRVIFWGNLGDFSWWEGIEWVIVSPLRGLWMGCVIPGLASWASFFCPYGAWDRGY